MTEQIKAQKLIYEFREKIYENLTKEEVILFDDMLELPFLYTLAQYKKHNKLHMYSDEVRLFNYFFDDFTISTDVSSLFKKIDSILQSSFGIDTVDFDELLSFVCDSNDTYSRMPFQHFVSLAIQNGFEILRCENYNIAFYNNKNVMLLINYDGKVLTECHIIFAKEDPCFPIILNSQNSNSIYREDGPVFPKTFDKFSFRFHQISTCNNVFHILSRHEEYIDSNCSEINLKDIWNNIPEDRLSYLFNKPRFFSLFFKKINNVYEESF